MDFSLELLVLSDVWDTGFLRRIIALNAWFVLSQD